MDRPPRPFAGSLWLRALPPLVLVLGLLAALAVGWSEQQRRHRSAEADFDRLVARQADDIARRFSRTVYGLAGARGAMATHERPRREVFRRYAATRDLDHEFPGVRGLGYIERFAREDLAAFVADHRADGAPDFALRRLSADGADDSHHAVIVYIEPAERNRGAVGLAVSSEAQRRAGLLRALTSGEATVTGVVTLVQDQRRSPGVLLYLPLVPRPGTAAAGRIDIGGAHPAREGVLYAPIVLAELLGDLVDPTGARVRLELFDNADGRAKGPLYFDSMPDAAVTPPARTGATPAVVAAASSAPAAAAAAAKPGFERLVPVALPGRTATLRVTSTPLFDAAYPTTHAWGSALGVMTVALLLASLLRQQILRRSQAEKMARRMTADLKRLALVAERTSNAVVITDARRHIVWVNEGFGRMTGFGLDDVLGQRPGALLQCEQTDAATVAAMRTALDAGRAFHGELCNRTRDGRLYWLDIDIQPLNDAQGRLTGFMAIQTDITERKHAEDALQASQLLLNHTGRIAGVGGWSLDAATLAIAWSDEARRLADLPPDAAPSLTDLLARCPHASRRLLQVALARALRRGEAFDLELPLTTGAGRAMWLRVVGEAERVGARTVRVLGALHDVTARRRLEDEIRRHSAVLRGAIDAIDEAFVLYDPDDRLVLCNERYRQLYAGIAHLMTPGASFEMLIRAGAEQGDYLDAVGRVDAWVAERMVQHRRADTTITQRLADGRTLRIVERKLADGHIVGFRVDITDLVRATAQAEQASREAARALVRLQAIHAILPVGILVTDPAGRVVDANPAAERLLGVSLAELLAREHGSSGWTVRREDGTPVAPSALPAAVALREGRAVHDEVLEIVTPRRRAWLSVSAVPVAHDELGALIGMVDVSEQRAQHRALLEATRLAEQASVAKSRFLANMSHEIRTPMNAVLGMLALLRRTPLTPRQADYAGKSDSAARSLLRLLDEILDFSKIEAGKLTLDPQPFAVETLLRDLGVILSAGVGDKPLELLFDVDAALPPMLVGDALRLQQVLVNLGGNAVKFTPAGEVLVALRVLERTAAAVTLRVAVSDTGIGIAPEHHERIFSGFSQAEASTTRRFGGTGLGVAISQRLAQLMGSRLELDSAPGRGSRFHFTLTLPVAAAPSHSVTVTDTVTDTITDTASDTATDATAAAASAAGADTAARPLRVLVVDDHPTARRVLRAACVQHGWAVEVAADGARALQQLAACRGTAAAHDVVFVDWQMAGLDGWETARRLRAAAPHGRAPLVVMVTIHGLDRLEERDAADQALIDGFLVKPVTAAMLAEAVAAAECARRAPAAAETPVAAAASARRLAGLRLLLTEDNPLNQQVACELLQDEGATVQVASDGREAVEALATGGAAAFDAVLMDLQMPVMDGFTATARIRHDLGLLRLPIVAMTANTIASDREACLAAGMNDHIGKPFDLDRLVAVLLQHTRPGTAVPPGAVAAAAAAPAHAAATVAAATGAVGGPPFAAVAAVAAATPSAASTLSAATLQAAAAAGVELAAALQRMGGKHTLYARALRDFAAELPALAQTLAGQRADGAAADHRRSLHTLKGLAATLGAKVLAALAARAEAEAARAAGPATAGPADATPALDELLRQLPLQPPLLHALLQTLPSGARPAAAARARAPATDRAATRAAVAVAAAGLRRAAGAGTADADADAAVPSLPVPMPSLPVPSLPVPVPVPPMPMVMPSPSLPVPVPVPPMSATLLPGPPTASPPTSPTPTAPQRPPPAHAPTPRPGPTG